MAVAGGVERHKAICVIAETQDGPPALGRYRLMVEGVNHGIEVAPLVVVFAVEGNERERWLATVVGEEEIGGGGEAAPGATNRAAT
jgi:hypothetical protein